MPTTKNKPKGALEVVKQQLRPLEFSDWRPDPNNPSPRDFRPDGTKKGLGFLGPLKRPDGGVSSELSVGVELDGKEMNIPTFIPTLARHEVDYLLTTPEDKIQTIDPDLYKSILDKAVKHATMRMKSGKSVFAEEGESPKTPPDLK
jgi:hypothetical protein